jgi:imidazolonepropionase-like amidohydrolase
MIWAKMPDFHHDSFRRALQKGVKIVFGTDVGGFPWDAVNEGMAPMQAIQSATRVAAELLDMDEQVGTLEKGKLADVSMLSRVSFVMKDGSVVVNSAARLP